MGFLNSIGSKLDNFGKVAESIINQQNQNTLRNESNIFEQNNEVDSFTKSPSNEIGNGLANAASRIAEITTKIVSDKEDNETTSITSKAKNIGKGIKEMLNENKEKETNGISESISETLSKGINSLSNTAKEGLEKIKDKDSDNKANRIASGLTNASKNIFDNIRKLFN